MNKYFKVVWNKGRNGTHSAPKVMHLKYKDGIGFNLPLTALEAAEIIVLLQHKLTKYMERKHE